MLLDGGIKDVGSGVNARSFGVAVKSITKASGSGSWCGPLPGLEGTDSPFPSRQEQMELLEKFWAEWDAEADIRARLLKSRAFSGTWWQSLCFAVIDF